MKALDFPLCVDLDGTLIKTDLLLESLFLLLSKHPLSALFVPFWLFQGKACLKQKLAFQLELDTPTLPYHLPFLNWLQEQKAQGRTLVLATAAAENFARQVADYTGLFSQVIATTATHNLSGEGKARRLCQLFGEYGFDYAGNARADVAVWAYARQAILVNPDRGVIQMAAKVTEIGAQFDDRTHQCIVWFKALRLHQWLKNVLIFLPLLAAHHFQEPFLFLEALIAFFAFGLCASSVYLLNDLLDLPADRRHPRKRNRPLAAGALPIRDGALATPLLLALALMLAGVALPPLFLGILLIYYVLTLGYSFVLKQAPMLDVVTLAVLYTLRIIAGAAAIRTPPSFWLLAFSMFFFLNLALIKRYAELWAAQQRGEETAQGRNYQIGDLPLLQAFGGASGYLSVLVLALYINSNTSQMLYRHSQMLWLLCPLLLYWISRTWLKTHRGVMEDDPVIFALRDPVSQLLVIVAGVIIGLAL